MRTAGCRKDKMIQEPGWEIKIAWQPGNAGAVQPLDRGKRKGDIGLMKFAPARSNGFTLVEILVVVSIIGLLAGLSIPAVGGGLNAARKAKVSAMAHQIRTSLTQFNTEYGYFPTNGLDSSGVGSTSNSLALVLAGLDTNNNPRSIVFLEVPQDFTKDASGNVSNGIVTPKGFYKNGQTNFFVSVDHNYDGLVTVTNGKTATNIRASAAVWFIDPKDSSKTIGTWK